MSDTPITPDDPRLTAYVLGELSDAESETVEAHLATSPACRRAVEELQETTALLDEALQSEPVTALTDAQRDAIHTAAAVPITPRRSADQTRPINSRRTISSNRTALVAFLTVTTVCVAVLFALLVPSNGSRVPEGVVVATNDPSQDWNGDPITLGMTRDQLARERASYFDFSASDPSNDVDDIIQMEATPLVVDRSGSEQPATASTHLSTFIELHNRELKGTPISTLKAPVVEGFNRPTALNRFSASTASPTQQLAEQEAQALSALTAENRPLVSGTHRWGFDPIVGTPNYETFTADVDIPFQQGSTELGVPLFDAYNGQWGVSNETDQQFVVEMQTPRIVVLEEEQAELGLVESTDNESYAPIVENPFTSPVDAPLSTFGLDVDTASYANVRRFLLDEGRLPPPDAVRIEELVNSFSYDDPQPVDEHPLRVSLESAACPWNESRRLVRIGVKGKEIDLADRPPTSLVFLIDTSGSMRDDNKLPLVKESLRLLVDEMSENDRIAIVTYSNDAGLLLDSTSGEHRDEIMSVIDSLHANGSTNGEAGLKTAYEVATQHKIDNGSNRVILCTDGDFNVGESEDAPLVQMISQKRDTGVHLSIFGFGTGNLKDAKLEQIADHGNGHYHYIDGLRQARRVFLDELTGTLYTIAKDVKLQIEFNPAHVGAYRLIGYENRTLAAEDFNNDRIDAGDLGAGHSVCALYEIVPPDAVRVRLRNEPNVDPLKYQPAESQETRAESKNASTTESDSQPSTTNPQLSSDLPATPEELRTVLGIIAKEKQAFEQHTKELQEEFGAEHPQVIAAREQMQELQSRIRHLERHQLELNEATPRTVSPDLLTVKLRYKRPTFFTSQKLEFPLIDDPGKQSSSNTLNWSAAVASFGMLLRNSAYRGDATFDSVLELARDTMGDDRSGQRAEFIDMVLKARQLYRQSHGTDSPPPPELSSLEARRKASLDGRYDDLLDKIQRPEDFKQYGAFHNRGWWTGPQDADEEGYPTGYWVYVYPHWYVWSETVGTDTNETPSR